MLQFRDFVPQQVEAGGFLHAARYQDFASAVAAASAWIETENIRLVQIETVVLPNVWTGNPQGTTSPALLVYEGSLVNQFIRCWFHDGA